MSVYASKRSESKVEFLQVTQELVGYTLKQVKKFPKSYQFILTNKIADLSVDIHNNVMRGNSIYVHKGMSEDEFRLRLMYFTEAKASVFSMSSLLSTIFSIFLEGNNFLGDKESMSKIFEHWAYLLNKLSGLLKSLIASDKKRYSSFTKDADSTNNSENCTCLCN